MSNEDAVTLTNDQILEIASEYQPVVPGNCLYILEFARALLSASKPAAPMEEFATAVRRMRQDETRGDMVFRCGFNGAIDAVLKLLAASPAAPSQSADPVATVRGPGTRCRALVRWPRAQCRPD